MWPFTSSPKMPRVTVTSGELFEAVRDQLSGRMAASCTIRLADASFYSVTQEEAAKFVSSAAGYWTAQINDCDDQAWMAKASAIQAQFKAGRPFAFGVIWTEDHALNWYLDPLRRIRLIDQPGASSVIRPITLILA